MKPVVGALVPSRCTAHRAIAVRLFATEPRICEAHLSAVVSVVTCSTQSSSSVSAATDALRHALLPFTPTGQVRPRDALGQSRTDKRPPSGGTTDANAKPFSAF